MNLKKFQNILITSKKNPDIDGLACMVAYAKILECRGIKSTPVVFGKLQQEAKYVLKKYHIDSILGCFVPVRNDNDFNAIILVDTSMRSTLDPKIDCQKVVQIIDHHKDPETKVFPNAEIIYEPIGALATYFVEIYMTHRLLSPPRNPLRGHLGGGCVIDKNTAILLYAAIISNTFNLKNSLTTERDQQAVNHLQKIVGISKDQFAQDMFTAKSKLIKKNFSQTIIDDSNFAYNTVSISQLEIIGIEKLIKDRFDEIITTLARLKKKHQAKMTFLNIVGLDECYNIIVALENKTQNVLEKILKIKFTNHLARTKKILMRKEIMPKLKEYLEKRKN